MKPSHQDERFKNRFVKDETWDKCVRRSSISIGIGGLLGGVSSIFLGTGGLLLSMTMCITWAAKHCRSLFHEQEEAKRKAILECCNPPSLQPSYKDEIIEQKEETSTDQDIKCLPILEPRPSPTFTFPPIIPIPDRPFGRNHKDTCENETEDSSECTCALEETDDYLQINCTCPLPGNNEYGKADDCSVSKQLADFCIECNETVPDTSMPSIPLEPNLLIPSPSPEPQCTCPPPEPQCTCPPPEPECTCPPPKPQSTSYSPPEPQCTCPKK